MTGRRGEYGGSTLFASTRISRRRSYSSFTLLVSFLLLLCCCCCLSSASSSSSSFTQQYIRNNNNKKSTINHLPGFHGPLPFQLQTGYVEVDESNGVRLFYYFIQSERNPEEDPLMLWLTGGPGCSAFSGLVYEIGPLSFDLHGYVDGLPKLVYKPDSWTKVSNVIFLDSPVGTGFSYSKTEQGYNSSDTKAVNQILIFLTKWFDEHPEFLSNPLYIAGDSYCGMIVPTVTFEIARGKEVGNEPALNLKGYIVGNPVTDDHFDNPSKVPFAHGMGLISDEMYEAYKTSCSVEDNSDQSVQCTNSLDAIHERVKDISATHILEPLCSFASPRPYKLKLNSGIREMLQLQDYTPELHPSEISSQCRTAEYTMSRIWANNGTVREVLGIHKGTIPSWIRCNHDIPYTKDIQSSVKYHLDVTTRGYRSLIYSGDHDMVVPFIGTQAWIRSLSFSIVDDWRPWYVDGQVAGFTRLYDNNLTFATVKGGGHTAPEYMPVQCVAMFARMPQHAQYALLLTEYDDDHRAHRIADEGVVLQPLRPRVHTTLHWDERYEPHVRQAGLLALARTVINGLPRMDGAALTALVDRWRPETHTFHLPSGEMTITLQDVAMILGLPIDGVAVSGDINSVGWRDRVGEWLGVRPEDPPADTRDNRPSAVLASWLRAHFNVCPPNADDDTVRRFARAWIWHLLGSFLFPDGTGNAVSWIYLPILANFATAGTYSWGSATLACLYRHLCDACRSRSADGNLGGCTYLLQVWMWERFPVGRPTRGPLQGWPLQDPSSGPTVAYLWSSIVAPTGRPRSRYIAYTNEFDVLTQDQVTWLPYTRGEVVELELNPMCERDSTLWMTLSPLVFFHAVEYHLPHRVMRQFGKLQATPPMVFSTNLNLHGMNRRRRYRHTDWAAYHQAYLSQWDDRENRSQDAPPIHQKAQFVRYLQWLHGVARLRLRPAMTDVDIAEGDSSEEGLVDDYDEFTRTGTQPERAPINAYYGTQLRRICNEAGEALKLPEGSEGSFQRLRDFAEMVRRRCRRLAAKMNCAAAAGEVVQPAPARSGSSRATTSGATTSASADPEDADDDAGEDEEGGADEAGEDEEGGGDEDDVDATLHDEMDLADLDGAPPPTQPTQATPRRRKRRDHADVSSVNVVEGTRGQHPPARFTPGSVARRKRK